MNVLFVQTGGTIDKDYPKGADSYHFEIKDPAIKRILDKTEPTFQYRIVTALQKDSLDIDHVDRQKVVDICQQAEEDKIVVTHGTDTMRLTAEALEKITNKTIVITGALRPERFSNSDADFNIGTALGALNVLPPGVYIAMSGRVLPWQHLKKDPKTGNFHLVEKSTE
jgi:L-asparaginase